jgi:hypothetical protein
VTFPAIRPARGANRALVADSYKNRVSPLQPPSPSLTTSSTISPPPRALTIMFAKKLALVALLAVSVYAQDTSSSVPNDTPTETSSGSVPSGSVTPCLLNCLAQATECPDPYVAFVFMVYIKLITPTTPHSTDASCVCTNTAFQNAVATCLQANCTPADVAQAQALQAELCSCSSRLTFYYGSSANLSSPASSVQSSITNSLSSRSVSSQSSVSSKVSSISSKASSIVNSKSNTGTTPTPTGTSSSGGSGGAAGLTASMLATGGAVLLGVIGGGLLVF